MDTLRADRIGAYGDRTARTPVLDALAAGGARFTRAYAPAPITLPSHASLMSGRYPARHGARHNGMPVDRAAPLLAESLQRAGFTTAAFVAAFPLDRRFGLERGFAAYGDRMPRAGGRPANERPGREVADEAIAWLATSRSQPSRLFLWIHLFEPHAPYGAPGDTRPAQARYADEVAEADRQIGRVLDALGTERARTLIVAAADHGEAFGEHGEIAHSLFVYDTTLRVPLLISGAGIAPRTVDAPVSLIDVAPTVLSLLRLPGLDTDGVDLGPALGGGSVPARELYAESFAPLLDFGWSPLRSVRGGAWKLIDAPRPELFRIEDDPGELRDLANANLATVADLRARVERYSTAALDARTPADPQAAARLQSLGYAGGGTARGAMRPDPKDRRDLAADLARVTSGDLSDVELEPVLRRILSVDAANPQAHLRLGFVMQGSGRCAEAVAHFKSAIQAGLPGADPHLGIAACQARARRIDAALGALADADRAEPGNPVVSANRGLLLSDSGRPADGVPALQQAVTLDPDFHEARFNLAIALARAGRRADAAREAAVLLQRLPPDAPQRPEVARLLASVR